MAPRLQTVEEFAAEMESLGKTLLADATEALTRCRPLILAGIEENFRQSQSAGGASWPPRKDPLPQHPLLILSGALLAAATGRHAASVWRILDGSVAEIGVDPSASSDGGIPGAGVHQYGHPARNIAQREYLGFSDKTIDACAGTVLDVAMEEIG